MVGGIDRLIQSTRIVGWSWIPIGTLSHLSLVLVFISFGGVHLPLEFGLFVKYPIAYESISQADIFYPSLRNNSALMNT